MGAFANAIDCKAERLDGVTDRMDREYQQCYAALGLNPPCEWEEVRLAYRRRVHRCHPDLDRNPGNSGEREAEFGRVVRAYRTLAAYRREHGSLPCSQHARRSTRRFLSPLRGPAGRTTGKQERRAPENWRRVVPRLHQAAFALFVAGVGSAALVGQLGRGEAGERQVLADGRLSVGMDPNEVVNVQGVPNYTKGSVWFYGKSGVIFDGDCVVGWENQPPFPLRTLTHITHFGAAREVADGGDCSAAAD